MNAVYIPACLVDGCERPAAARGWCRTHYSRWRRTGRTDLRTAEERFWQSVNKTDECWLWVRDLNSDGYGIFAVNAGRVMAHRFAYELLVGPIPEGLQLDHLCRTPACVHPDHLEPVTAKENTARGMRGSLRTHCKHGHEYTEDNLVRTKNGVRRCKTCHREGEARRAEKRRVDNL